MRGPAHARKPFKCRILWTKLLLLLDFNMASRRVMIMVFCAYKAHVPTILLQLPTTLDIYVEGIKAFSQVIDPPSPFPWTIGFVTHYVVFVSCCILWTLLNYVSCTFKTISMWTLWGHNFHILYYGYVILFSFHGLCYGLSCGFR